MIAARRFTLFCSLVLLLLASNTLAQTQKHAARSSDTYQGLHISIRLDKTSYRFGDIATVKVILKNIGDAQVTIYKKLGWGCLGSLGYGLADRNGRGLMPTFIPGSFYSPPFPREDFITLKPGETVRAQRGMQIGRREGIKTLGVYQLTVWYHNPVSQDFAPEGLQMWVMEGRNLVARPVRFTVTK